MGKIKAILWDTIQKWLPVKSLYSLLNTSSPQWPKSPAKTNLKKFCTVLKKKCFLKRQEVIVAMWLRRKENKEKCMGKNVLILKLPESRDSVWNANVLQIIIQKRLRKWVDGCTCAQILAIISSCCQLFFCSVNSAEWQFQAFEKKCRLSLHMLWCGWQLFLKYFLLLQSQMCQL